MMTTSPTSVVSWRRGTLATPWTPTTSPQLCCWYPGYTMDTYHITSALLVVPWLHHGHLPHHLSPACGTLATPWTPTTSPQPCCWYPGYTMDTYHITSALLVLSLRLGLKDRPDDLVDTLCVRPSHLPVTASVRGPVHKSLAVGNYNLSPADMDTLKHSRWLNDNVSTL